MQIPDDLPDARLSVEQRRNIFLVVKESLNNILKHAGATEVEVRMSFADARLELEIVDNGSGFEPQALQEGGTGLLSMRHRAEEMGGTFSVASKPGSGTRVGIYLKCGIASKGTNR